MKKNSSLTCAYLLDGNGGGRALTWNDVNSWTPEQGILWVHANFTHKKTKTWLKKAVDHISYLGLTAEDVRPRTTPTNHSMLLFLRGVNTNPRQDPEDMISIRIFFNQNMIITTHRRNLTSANYIAKALEENTGPKTPGEFITMINDQLTQHMNEAIEDLTDAVDALEDEMIEQESHELRPKISNLRREAILFRRYLAPQREALHRLVHEKTTLLDENNILYLREIQDRLNRYIEDLDSARERASITQEELSSRLNERMESRMYVLSIVAVIFLPLSFITGLLGINVGGIPGNNQPNAFYIVSGLCGLIFLILFIVLKRKKWI